MTIYTPTSLDQAKEIATLISDRPQDCLRLHAAFGAHFGGDMAITQNNAFMLRGEPSLRADAMAGIVRRSGLCRYMAITSWDQDHCTYTCARTDEPESIVHTFTFTIEMAKAQGLTNNRNWRQMPMQMLRARALTLMLRATYPDAVSGIYSPDELADSMSISDDERARISADSLGEELQAPSRAPRQMSRPPQQHEAINSEPPAEQGRTLQGRTPQEIARGLYEMSQIGELDEESGEISEHSWAHEDDVQMVLARGQAVSNWDELEVFTIGLWTLANKPNNATPDAIDAIYAEAQKLGYSDAKLGI